ncbi:MAG: serine hydrolase domain-containing protein, partial [Gemmatimonadaceae bacterium]
IPGVSVVIAKGQQIVWARGFGIADIERQLTVTPTTSFHLASLTKPFASTVIMQLVEEGKVSLDDPVSKYGIQLQNGVLVRHLLTHTSEGVPGAVFRYNGNLYGLLDSVIHHATGHTFAQELETRILDPLHLPNSAPNNLSASDFFVAGLDRTAFESNLARGYTVSGSTMLPTGYPSYFGTAAGLIASSLDVAAFSMAMDRDAFLNPTTKALMYSPARSTNGGTLPYGLGWFVTQSGGVKLVWHYGLWTAISSLIIKVPERGLTYIVLANTSGISEPYDIVGDLRNSPWAREFLDAFVNGSAALSLGAELAR